MNIKRIARGKTNQLNPRLALFLSLIAILFSNCDGTGTENDDTGDDDGSSDGDSDSDGDTDLSGQCAGGKLDLSNDLCWQDPGEEGNYDWQEAADYCDALNLEGHDDWRLPTKDEFIWFLGDCDNYVESGDNGYCNSCEQSDVCSSMFGADTGWYWSSTDKGPDAAWVGYFDTGRLNWYRKDGVNNMRCVREE